MKKLIVALLVSFPLLLHAQLLDHVQGEVMVMLRKQTNARQWAKKWEQFRGKNSHFQVKKLVSPPLDVWSYRFDHTQVNEYELLAAIRRDEEVQLAQFIHFVTMRSTIPDDPQFDSQWQYINTGQDGGTVGADIDMDLAWDLTTGGLTAQGDTIVVCALDDGIDINHEDFEDNRWINYGEIPDNGIDDDNNGYVDDYLGWNPEAENDDINGGGHGTPVAGIMGAKGNNGIGVAGISWNVKVMVLRNNFNTDEAAVLSAYSYPLVQRMRYNATNGEEGAFVVATNASWGIDLGDPADAPLWCAFYDTLGTHGILNCGATINGNVDVDIEGDLPTACPSDYLIAVTNMNRNDEKVTGAGYGATTIDLGAFGAQTWTTSDNNSYGPFGGTSGATPHVTGTIGLLYSLDCPGFINLAKADPGAAAKLAKQCILEGVDPNPTLDTITVTGGRLNVFNSLMLLLENCDNCFPPSSPQTTANVTDEAAELTWVALDTVDRIDLRWRVLNGTTWDTILNVNAPPFTLMDLTACTFYEVQLQGYCGDTVLDWTQSLVFRTDGCCEPPQSITIDDITSSGAIVNWSPVLAAESYIFRFRLSNTLEWTEITTTEISVSLTDLTLCTGYDIQILTNCGGELSLASEVQTFFTTDCGFCIETEYCQPQNLNASEEWIESVLIGDLENTSGNDGNYGSYTHLETLVLAQGNAYNMVLTPGYAGDNYSEEFRVYIDLDHNGSFSNDEVVFQAEETVQEPLVAELVIPADANPGLTRMRVVMQFQQVDGPCPFGQGNFGEVEDYCVEIVTQAPCGTPEALQTADSTETTISLIWPAIEDAISYIIRYRPEGGDWMEEAIIDPEIVLSGLAECLAYEVQLKTVCGNAQSGYSPSFLTHTACATSTKSIIGLASWQCFPNPFQEQLTINLQLTQNVQQAKVVLLDAYGREVLVQHQGPLSVGRQTIQFDTESLPAGLYWVQIKSAQGAVSKKVICMD